MGHRAEGTQAAIEASPQCPSYLRCTILEPELLETNGCTMHSYTTQCNTIRPRSLIQTPVTSEGQTYIFTGPIVKQRLCTRDESLGHRVNSAVQSHCALRVVNG